MENLLKLFDGIIEILKFVYELNLEGNLWERNCITVFLLIKKATPPYLTYRNINSYDANRLFLFKNPLQLYGKNKFIRLKLSESSFPDEERKIKTKEKLHKLSSSQFYADIKKRKNKKIKLGGNDEK